MAAPTHACVIQTPVCFAANANAGSDTAYITDYKDAADVRHRTIKHAPLKGVTKVYVLLSRLPSSCLDHSPRFWELELLHSYFGSIVNGPRVLFITACDVDGCFFESRKAEIIRPRKLF